MKSTIVITCALYVSEYVKQEIEQLGYEIKLVLPTSVEIVGTMEDCMRLNFYLRGANKVLFQLQEFRAHHAQSLYDNAFKMEWENYIPVDGYFTVSSVVNQRGIDTPLYANVKLKDAIVDRFRTKFNRRPDSGSDRGQTAVFLFWKDNIANLYLDTSGETLHKHGYRFHPYKAPMQESLAASLLMACNWDQKISFVNPMCGSGTLAIEAALLAGNRPPGLLRSNYAFMHLNHFNADYMQDLIREARKNIADENVPEIVASDISEEAIKCASYNARMAGVDHLIKFEVSDFSISYLPNSTSLIFFNPPYGQRLGDDEELLPLYKSIGDFLKKRCAGSTGAVFSANVELAKYIGLKPSRKIDFFSAQLPCKLFLFNMYSGTKKQKPA